MIKCFHGNYISASYTHCGFKLSQNALKPFFGLAIVTRARILHAKNKKRANNHQNKAPSPLTVLTKGISKIFMKIRGAEPMILSNTLCYLRITRSYLRITRSYLRITRITPRTTSTRRCCQACSVTKKLTTLGVGGIAECEGGNAFLRAVW